MVFLKLPFSHFFLLVIIVLLGGCQPKVYLMPSPAAIRPDGDLFKLTEANSNEEAIFSFDNYLFTLYATNRQPIHSVNNSGTYSIFPSDTLRLGFTVHRVGDRDMTWEEMIEQSVRADRGNKLLLENVYRREAVAIELSADLEVLPDQADGVFERINSILAKSFDKDILLYIHGANSNFYRATAQAAQFYHFTGHNSLVMTFSWPSAENLLKYKTDVLHARKTIPAFARLIQILSKYTNARNINILAYSAGAQVVAPGLASLGDRHPTLPADEIKKRLRIGEVYFAAPDTDFKAFIQRYLKFKDIVERTTININEKDSVLRLAAFQNGVSRLGRPDLSELSEEEGQLMIAAMETQELDILDVGKSQALKLGSAHNSWYNHPWVSNDLLLLFLFNADPMERGLEEHYYQNGAKTFHFPLDYDRNIRKILDEQKEDFERNLLLNHKARP
jgi:esterase/lipase superfamily enzyme